MRCSHCNQPINRIHRIDCPSVNPLVQSSDCTVKEPPKNKYTKEDLAFFLKEIRQSGRDLSPWEFDFIQSIQAQLRFQAKLSDRQIEKLEQIYADHTSLGPTFKEPTRGKR